MFAGEDVIDADPWAACAERIAGGPREAVAATLSCDLVGVLKPVFHSSMDIAAGGSVEVTQNKSRKFFLIDDFFKCDCC